MNVTPNLFIVGFQKCGSSSLFDLLTQHPQVIGTMPKETFALTDKGYEHYDTLNNINNHPNSFNWGVFFPTGNSSSDIKYYLEASVCNFYQETALSYIENNPKAKVIFILRDPIERFISTYTYFGGSGIHLSPGISIEDYFHLVQKKAFNKEAMNYALEHGRYSRFVSLWKQKIGAHQILILGLKPLIMNTSDVMNQIWDFLEINRRELCEFKHINKSRPVRYKRLNRLLVNIFGGRKIGKSWIAKLYHQLNSMQSTSPILSKKLEEKLKEYYFEEYKLFQQFF